MYNKINIAKKIQDWEENTTISGNGKVVNNNKANCLFNIIIIYLTNDYFENIYIFD